MSKASVHETPESTVEADDQDLDDLLEELGDGSFKVTSGAIRRFDAETAPDGPLESFINDYARLCADLFHAGFVPSLEGELPFIVQAVRALDALDLEKRNQGGSRRGARRATRRQRAEDRGPQAPRGRRPVRVKRR